MSDWQALSYWGDLPKSLYVTSANVHRNVVFDVAMCSVPMALVPEVRYVRADYVDALRAENERMGEALVWAANQPMIHTLNTLGASVESIDAAVDEWLKAQPRHYEETLDRARKALERKPE